MVTTAPRPVICVVEPGMLSMRNSNLPAWEAFDAAKFDEFMKWALTSAEARNFDTIAIDSVSQIAEIILTEELKKNKDPRKAYGEMSRRVMEHVNSLYFAPNKHIYMICKQGSVETGKQTIVEGGVFRVESIIQRRPYFPGQDLNIKVPHLFDEIVYVGRVTLPGQNKEVVGLRTVETSEFLARDRSGNLAEIEPPDLTALFNKAMVK